MKPAWDTPRVVRRVARRASLARRLLALQLAVVALIVGVFSVLAVLTTRARTEESERERARSVAETVAQAPSVRAALATADPASRLQPVAERIRRRTGVAFVVVMSPQGMRYSHPNPDRIGERFVGTIAPAARGRALTEVYEGTLGPSVRAVVPVRGRDERITGLVAVGVLQEQISAQLADQLPGLLVLALAALAVGIGLSLLVARRVKRQTLNLEPREIAALYQHHDATLHAIREGVLVVDAGGRVLLGNDEAARLLGLPEAVEGRPVEDVLPAGPLRDLVTAGTPVRDAVVLAGDRVLVANQSTAQLDGRALGTVVTLRDRTELQQLVRELDAIRAMADSLRAQAHESANRLHTLVGLVELGRYDEAVSFATEQVELAQELLGRLQERIEEPALVALLLGKVALARERGVELEVAEETRLEAVDLPPGELVTIVGNLVDNAVDAVAATGAGGWVEVALWSHEGDVLVEVRDSGPGIAPEHLDKVFESGWSTKDGGGRGLGLALVRHAVTRLGGSIEAANDGGAVFTVRLPVAGGRRLEEAHPR
jgi:two-component system CitB family sensor kinase